MNQVQFNRVLNDSKRLEDPYVSRITVSMDDCPDTDLLPMLNKLIAQGFYVVAQRNKNYPGRLHIILSKNKMSGYEDNPTIMKI